MVSGLGFEPRMTGPKPVVIPFHHPEVNFSTKEARSTIRIMCNLFIMNAPLKTIHNSRENLPRNFLSV